MVCENLVMHIYAVLRHDFYSISYYSGENDKIIVKIFKITEKSHLIFRGKIV